jgi:hypothetical protein
MYPLQGTQKLVDVLCALTIVPPVLGCTFQCNNDAAILFGCTATIGMQYNGHFLQHVFVSLK